MDFVEITNEGIRPVDKKTVQKVPRMVVYVVQGNDYPIVEWEGEDGVKRSAQVAIIGLKPAPPPAPVKAPEKDSVKPSKPTPK